MKGPSALKQFFWICALIFVAATIAGCGSAGPLVKPDAAPRSPLTGRVVDAASGQPAAGVKVFGAGTTYRTTTDGRGAFSLSGVPVGTHEVVAHQPGYTPIAKTVPHGPQTGREVVVRLSTTTETRGPEGGPAAASDSTALSSLPPAATRALKAMKQRVDQLEARVALISRQVDLLRDEQRGTALLAMNEEDLDTFKQFFLGDDREGCRLLNPGVLSEPTDGERGTLLRATTDQPLEVLNRRLGYRLRVVIDAFSVAEAEDEYSVFGDALVSFEALTPSGEDEAERWREARLDAYRGSFTHLLRALGAGRSEDENFSLARPAQVNRQTSSGLSGRTYTTT